MSQSVPITHSTVTIPIDLAIQRQKILDKRLLKSILNNDSELVAEYLILGADPYSWYKTGTLMELGRKLNSNGIPEIMKKYSDPLLEQD